MAWVIGALVVALIAWMCMVAFNLWATEKLRRFYGYSWEQVKTHVCFRGYLEKRGVWRRTMGPGLAPWLKALPPDELLLVGSRISDDQYKTRLVG
jgi:hypothetical protein